MVARNMDELIDFAKYNGVPLIEDCAHSLGASYNGLKIGNFSQFSIFSLTKNTINFGGGILATNDTDLFRKAQAILEREKVSFNQKAYNSPKIF